MHFPVSDTSHDVKVQFHRTAVLVIFPDTMNESVKTMPVVYFGNTDKVDSVFFFLMECSDWYAVKVYAIGYATGLLSEDKWLVRECYDSIGLFGELITEYLVNNQFKSIF